MKKNQNAQPTEIEKLLMFATQISDNGLKNQCLELIGKVNASDSRGVVEIAEAIKTGLTAEFHPVGPLNAFILRKTGEIFRNKAPSSENSNS